MIPDILLDLIRQGKAESKTWVHGVGGVGRIPVGENQFIIIYHYDYFGFVDLPTGGGSPAVASADIIGTLLDPVKDTVQFDLGIGLTDPFNIDIDFPADSLTDAQIAVDGIISGWTVSLMINPLTFTMTWTITTEAPGDMYNGLTFDIISFDGYTVVPGIFAGGAPVTFTATDILKRSTHQLEFRSEKSKNHFIIRDDVEIYPTATGFFANVSGHYSKDCYLVHTDFVQINIVTVPDPEDWNVTNFSQLPQKSQEDPVPAGYGQTPSIADTVREVMLAFGDEQYLPLTEKYETIQPSEVLKYREQFKIDVNNTTKLSNPKTNISNLEWNRRSYPILNIDYVLVNFNINQFVQGS